MSSKFEAFFKKHPYLRYFWNSFLISMLMLALVNLVSSVNYSPSKIEFLFFIVLNFLVQYFVPQVRKSANSLADSISLVNCVLLLILGGMLKAVLIIRSSMDMALPATKGDFYLLILLLVVYWIIQGFGRLFFDPSR